MQIYRRIMRMVRFYKLEVLGLMLVVMGAMMKCGWSVLHRVGEKQGWSSAANYTEWSSSERFYIGDWLLFVFDKHVYNVLEVNKTSYEKCNDKNFIHNITRGGRDVVQLTEARPYYFLSGGGFCWQGMKLALFVEETPPVLPPQPNKDASPSNVVHLIRSFVAVSIALAFGFSLNLY